MKKLTDHAFLTLVKNELKNARTKFPESNAVNCALVEEVGEVSTALMYEPWNRVVAECVQVAAMAARLAVEGDPTMTEFRNEKVHENGRRYGGPEFTMPGSK
jgi:hypothetical protein